MSKILGAAQNITHIEFRFSLKKEKNKEENTEKKIINAKINELNPIDEIKKFWINSFPGVNFTQKHSRILEKLLKKNSISYIKNYLQEQWDFVKNNAVIKNRPAYFSSLILEKKSVPKDYIPEECKKEMELFEKPKNNKIHILNTKNLTEEDFIQIALFPEKNSTQEENFKEELIEITKKKYEEKFNTYMRENNLKDEKIQKKIFNLMTKRKYKVKEKEL